MKSNYLLIYFLLLSTFGFAQNYDIGGVIKESDSGIPIPGANVTIQNTSLGTSTDFDGKFSLKNVPAGAVLMVSYLGFKDYQFKVTGSNTNLSLLLQSDTKSLQEVVVIGYGTQKRKDVTGSIGLLSAKAIEQIKPIKLEQALMGTVAGVTVTAQSGAPGAPLDIRIRGIQSNGDNAPMIVIDGNIISYNDFGFYNPNDFETITVLKDSQAAIYGTRGANGVVLLTTKTGKKNTAARFSYNGYTGMQETTKKIKVLNATEYALLLNESYGNSGAPLQYPDVSKLGKGTNWQDEVFGNNVPIFSHDINISGGGDKFTYSLSGSHLYQEGIVGGDKSDYRRSTARLSMGADLSDRLKLQANVFYSYFNRDSLLENALGSVLFNAINAPSTLEVYDADGNFTRIPSTTGFSNETINPLAQIANTFNDYNGKNLNGNIGLDYELAKNLVVTGRMGFKTVNNEERIFRKQVDYGPSKVFNVTRSSVSQNVSNYNSYTFDLFATYKKTFAESHNFAATLGITSVKEWGNILYATGYDVPYNSWENADIDLARGTSGARDIASGTNDDRLNSYFVRLQYDFRGKYLVSAMLRRDSSTFFGPSNAVAYFPSATLGWIVSEENFLKDLKTLSFFKFRASYGILGNDKIRANAYTGLLDGSANYVFDNTITSGTAIGYIPNPNVKWEEARKFDLGVDLKLFSNAIDITADYFIESRYNLLIGGLPISGITGVAGPGGVTPVVNAGSTRNVGYEFAIGYNKKFNDNLSFGINYNITTIKNEVTKVSNSRGIIETGGFSVSQPPIARMEQGESIGYFYGWQTDGIFQNQAEVAAHPSQSALGSEAHPGDVRYKDLNGDGVIDLNDRAKVGSPLPDFTMGLNFNLVYKNVDLAAYSYASVGNDMVRNYERAASDVNKLNYRLERWTGEGSTNAAPRVSNDATSNNIFSDRFVEDASFFRIQNVQLGYTLNNDFSKKAGISKLRLYVGVNNVYTFTKYKGYDPAASNGQPIGQGIDIGYYPVPRTYMCGLNLNF